MFTVSALPSPSRPRISKVSVRPSVRSTTSWSALEAATDCTTEWSSWNSITERKRASLPVERVAMILRWMSSPPTG